MDEETMQAALETSGTPVRLQLSRRKGFDLQAQSRATNGLPAVTVARPSRFGNPFIVGQAGNQAYCVELFRYMLAGKLALNCGPTADEQEKHRAEIERNLDQLRGKNLACWCKLAAPCHADVLIELANREAVA